MRRGYVSAALVTVMFTVTVGTAVYVAVRLTKWFGNKVDKRDHL